VRFRTDVGSGRPRVRRAVGVLEQAGLDEAVIDQVQDLDRWLGEFSADALLELDYASVAGLFSEADLVLDDSVDAVAASIGALADFDYERAGESYAAVAARWAQAQSLLYVN
jgi:hypothetical protein